MNNRDPFNLRSTSASAFTVLQNRASIVAETAADHGRKAVEAGRKAIEEAAKDFQSASQEKEREKYTPPLSPTSTSDAHDAHGGPSSNEDMSFAIPRNVPSFHDPVRQYEDTAWRSRTQPQHSNGNGIAANLGIDGIFSGGGKGLPMYKDKPYNYSTSQRRKPMFRQKRVLLALLVTVGTVGWWLDLFGTFRRGELSDVRGTMWTGSKGEQKINWDERREKVRDAFKETWSAYEKHAWGFDEFHPIAKSGRQMVQPHGMGWIIVDALDTLMIMNLTTQLAHAREWMTTTLNYDIDHDVNTFETTIRMLGGLLSAHYLSTTFPDMAPIPVAHGSNAEDLYLEKAVDLAERLLGAYDSKSGVPYASVNLKTRQGIVSHADGGASSTAEATSLQLEMKYLSKLTGEKMYWDKAEKVMEVVDSNGAQDGLLPIFIYADRGTFRDNNIRLGSRGDSYYEYLIKQYLQTSEPIYLSMWQDALEGVKKHLITYSYPSNFTVLAERPSGLDGALEPKMDHLVCFMPGTIALATTGGSTVEAAKKRGQWDKVQEEELELAKQLMKTCWGMYKVTASGLAPEIAHFKLHDPPKMMKDGVLQSPDTLSDTPDADWMQDYVIKSADTHNLQRPETVESLLYMWRITGDEMYREWGWEMFESFMTHTRIEGGGFSSIGDVQHIPPPWRDNMESFWLAETLKYFYLLFSPNDVLPLDQIVLNTEAHPLPRFDMGKLFFTGWRRKPRKNGVAMANSAREEPKSAPGKEKLDAQIERAREAARENFKHIVKTPAEGGSGAGTSDEGASKGMPARVEDDKAEQEKQIKKLAMEEVKRVREKEQVMKVVTESITVTPAEGTAKPA